jgi:signal transduction histidine kinase
MGKYLYFFYGLLCLVTLPVMASSPVQVSGDTILLYGLVGKVEKIPVNHALQVYFPEAGHNPVLADLQENWQDVFAPYGLQKNKYARETTCWARFSLTNTLDYATEWVLYLAPRGTNYARVYLIDQQGKTLEKKAGEFFPYYQKDLPAGRQCKVKLKLKPRHTYTCYIVLHNTDYKKAAFDVRLASPEHYQAEVGNRNLFQGIFMGVVIIMVLYNLFLYFLSKEKAYFWYATYISGTCLFFLYYHGFLLETVLRLHPTLHPLVFLLAGAAPMFFFQFLRTFTNTRQRSPRWDKTLKIAIRIRGAVLVVEATLCLFFQNMAWMELISTYSLLAMLTLSSFALVRLLPLQRNLVIFLAVGTFSLLLMTLLGIYLQFYWNFAYAVSLIQAGMISQILFFSLGLGYRFKQNDELRIAKQQVLIEQLRESEKQRIELNQELERKVEERTRKIQEHQQEIALQAKELVEMNWELYEKNDQLYSINNSMEKANEALKAKNHELEVLNEKLNNTLAKLKAAQVQLIQSEKMASVGLLTAGIAHEINNPINFVYAGADTLQVLLGDLVEILNQYAKISPENSHEELRAFLQDMERIKEETGFEETLEDIYGLVADIKNGARRTAEIVKGLRNFSRLDEDEQKSAHVHEGLDSTLTLLRGQLRDQVKIVKDYSPDVPEIDCYPGPLNQVFMNILTNAIHAVQKNSAQGEIRISTAYHVMASAGQAPNAPDKEAFVTISVRDNGMGMSEQIKQRIFEPFYTTKQVGEGTGLGLSISLGIIEKHKGTISVESAPGQGTTFILRLPVSQKH